ncbi:hypothetical protein [Spirosoma sp.]|uniref:hypothetical protein n=1 Tax=Spirosoma sp. TaxID=1899569 RepID=UPI00262AF3C0|nr:hypothetical protein [Spirosoma sp.]MCX6217612.1 hypothetical protein [Spirosoma sp.]
MINYFLNSQLIEAPQQADGLTLKKTRNLTYWGFLYRKLGYVAGPTNLIFDDADTVSVIRQAALRYGIQAETSLRMEEFGEVIYEGFLDYKTYRYDGTVVSIGLRDNRAVLDLSSNAGTAYALPASQKLSLHERRLAGVPSLVTDPKALTVQRSEISAVFITHSVPFTRKSETDDTIAGTLAPVVVPILSDPCYYNTSSKTQTVKLTGVISVTASASSSLTAMLYATPSDSLANRVLIGQIAVSSTASLKTIAVDVSVPVAAGASLKIDWFSSTGVSKWVFTYDAQTGVALSDEKTSGGSVTPAETLYSVISQLVAKTSGGSLTFSSNWLRTGGGSRLLLANGAGLRGISKPLAVSLAGLFAGLNSISCLALWAEGDTVRLEPRTDKPKTVTRLESVLGRGETIAADYLYNAVQVGYDTWQADTGTLTNDEPCGQRSYSTGITATKNELKLVSDLITSSTVIETQRRKQFDSKLASESKADSLDDRLFLICGIPVSGGWKAERTENTPFITGNYDTSTLYNVGLTPGRMLRNWLLQLGSSLPLSAQSVLGSDSLRSTYKDVAVSESDPVPYAASRPPMLVVVETPMGMADYANLGEFCSYPFEGNTYTGELLDAEWKLTETGETATLLLLER